MVMLCMSYVCMDVGRGSGMCCCCCCLVAHMNRDPSVRRTHAERSMLCACIGLCYLFVQRELLLQRSGSGLIRRRGSKLKIEVHFTFKSRRVHKGSSFVNSVFPCISNQSDLLFSILWKLVLAIQSIWSINQSINRLVYSVDNKTIVCALT